MPNNITNTPYDIIQQEPMQVLPYLETQMNYMYFVYEALLVTNRLFHTLLELNCVLNTDIIPEVLPKKSCLQSGIQAQHVT